MMRQRMIINTAVMLAWTLTLPSTLLAQQDRPAVQLPDGEAKAIVEGTCAACHRLDFIPNSRGYTHEDWEALIGTMITLPGDTNDSVVEYLAEHFPKKPGTDPTLISGPVNVSISEWIAPTLGSRPHDPFPAADGSIWWTGQFANRLGRVDPVTGAMQEFPLETASSGPHGLQEDGSGNIWFTAVSQGYVGKLDPNTGDVTEYHVSEGRGPHTPTIDQQGAVWFTMQSGHVGRIVPDTEEMTISATPTSGTYPYGIKVNSQGVPWYVDYRGSRVGSVDPDTAKITEYELPNPESRPRRIALTPDDAVWYTDYPRGYLGRFDPETGDVQEWASPGGPGSLPYGIAAIGDVIWYVETYSRPNTLVRFDTQTERFQSWVIPSGGGVVRHMEATPDGNLVLACSAVNRVALVEIET